MSNSVKNHGEKVLPKPANPKPGNPRDMLAWLHNDLAYLDQLYRQHKGPTSAENLSITLKISSSKASSFLSLCSARKVLKIYEPEDNIQSSSQHKTSLNTRVFAFDQIFIPSDPLSEVSGKCLGGILQAVLNGFDGCVLSFGLAKTEKSKTMINCGHSVEGLGILPLAIAWLFHFIIRSQNENQTQISVTMTAFVLSGVEELQKDLLSSHDTNGCHYLRKPTEIPLQSSSDALQVLEQVAALTKSQDENDHLICCFNLYKKHSGRPATEVFSRLHLIGFGGGSGRSRSSQTPGLSGLLSIMQAVLAGQRSLPFKDSMLTKAVLDSIGSDSCRISIIAHVNPSLNSHHDILQLARSSVLMQELRKRSRAVPFVGRSSLPGQFITTQRHRRTIQMGTGTLAPIATSNFYSDPEVGSARWVPPSDPSVRRGMAFVKNQTSKSETKWSDKKEVFDSCTSLKDFSGSQPFQPSKMHTISAKQVALQSTKCFGNRNAASSVKGPSITKALFSVQEQWVDGPAEFRIYGESNDETTVKSNPVQSDSLFPVKKLFSSPRRRKTRGESEITGSDSVSADQRRASSNRKHQIKISSASFCTNLNKDSKQLQDFDAFASELESVYETVMEEHLEDQTVHNDCNSLIVNSFRDDNCAVSIRSNSKTCDRQVRLIRSRDSEMIKCKDSSLSTPPSADLCNLFRAASIETTNTFCRLNNSKIDSRNNSTHRIIRSHETSFRTELEKPKKGSVPKGFPRLGSNAIPRYRASFSSWNERPSCAKDDGLHKRPIRSPYTAVTEPRSPTATTSSGLGSEVSSSVSSGSYHWKATSRSKSETGYSSEYESLVRDVNSSFSKNHPYISLKMKSSRRNTENKDSRQGIGHGCTVSIEPVKSKDVSLSSTDTKPPRRDKGFHLFCSGKTCKENSTFHRDTDNSKCRDSNNGDNRMASCAPNVDTADLRASSKKSRFMMNCFDSVN